MGTEGHEVPRDVVDKKQKHPWEVQPEDETSAKLSGKQREKLEKKKQKREKRKLKNEKRIKWIKSHRILILIFALMFVALIGAGIFVYYKIDEKNRANNAAELENTMEGFPENPTIENAYTSHNAFSYALRTVMQDVALVGVDQANPDASKVEDNMNAYIETLTSDYEKLYYKLFTYYLISLYEYPERAIFLLQNFDSDNTVELDKKQRYVYLKAYEEYYHATSDTEKFKEYAELIEKEYEDEDSIMINEDTGEVFDIEKEREKYEKQN
jgi:hypothetical protein